MKIKQLNIHTRPICQANGCRMLAKGLIIREADFSGEVTKCAQDEELTLQQILPSMWKMSNHNQGEDGERLHPSCNVLDLMTLSFGVRGKNKAPVE